jgi:hypothetical protein
MSREKGTRSEVIRKLAPLREKKRSLITRLRHTLYQYFTMAKRSSPVYCSALVVRESEWGFTASHADDSYHHCCRSPRAARDVYGCAFLTIRAPASARFVFT